MKRMVEEKKSKKEKERESILENIFYSVMDIYYYFYFVTSTLALILYFTNHMKGFEITTIIIIIGIVIDLLLGYTRNIFGTLGLIIASVLGVYLLKDIKIGIFLGIAICTFISSTIVLIICRIVSFLIRKFSSK